MSEQLQNLSPNKQALLKIRELKERLAERSCERVPIAIVSMACRFPRRLRTPELFWQTLLDGADQVGDIPDDRWDLKAFYDQDPDVPGKMYATRGVFLDRIDTMDPEFFGISPREATWVDPQQRLLLEVGWEALERAGWQVEKIGQHTGVFIGWMHNDYQNEASDSFLNLNPYIATGAAGSFLPGRIAYHLGLHGPSLAVDTACSSSLVALHLACQSLWLGECEHALVGGVNAIVSPTTNILTCKLKALSPTGQSRAFDAAADGYLRGEGCGVVTLRRLEDAQRDGDPILGIIRGSAVGHNGFSSGLTAPNPRAQETVIRQAVERAGVSAAEVAYLEAHGTGTELGDPIELQAAAAALGEDRDEGNPLLVGSVKTNIGHLEAAAGMAGLIKVLLAMQKDKIPGQLNFENPNPHIPWDRIPVQVVTEPTDWPENSHRRIAGVSAFGMSGTNAHVIIEAPQRLTNGRLPKPHQNQNAEGQLLVLSGKCEEALPALAGDYASTVADEDVDLDDVCYTSGVGRSHFEHRAAIVVPDRKTMVEALRSLERGADHDSLYRRSTRQRPRVAWQFTGQGSQYPGMAKELYESEPVFREVIERCDQSIRKWREQSLIDVLWQTDDKRILDHTSWTQPAIFAIQMGLTHLLQHWGLRPDLVLGHSVGQFAAACSANAMSWDDGLRLICERGKLIGDLPTGGRMLAVFASVDEIQNAVDNHPDVSIAAFNGSHIVVSGESDAIQSVQEHFASIGRQTKPLNTSHAFHSHRMDPILEAFASVADGVTYQQSEIPLVCNVTGKVIKNTGDLDGAYWARHIRQTVCYQESIHTVQELNCDVVLEIGPQSVLTRMARSCLRSDRADASHDITFLSSLERESGDNTRMAIAVARLFTLGAMPDFDAIFAGKDVRRVALPTYPFQQRRFWGPAKPRASHAEYHSSHPLLGTKISLAGLKNESRYESFVEADSPSWLPDHQVMGQVVMPAAALIEQAWSATENSDLEDIVFEQPLRPTTRSRVQTIVHTHDDNQTSLEIYSNASGADSDDAWVRHFQAHAAANPAVQPQRIELEPLSSECTEEIASEEFYRLMDETGLQYGPSFQTIASLKYSDEAVLASLKSIADIRGHAIAPTLLDGAFHCLAVGLVRREDDSLFLPVGVGRATLFQPAEQQVQCYAKWGETDGQFLTADITLFNETGSVIATIESLRVQKMPRAVLRQMSGSGSRRLIHEIQWRNFRLTTPISKKTNWLIIGDDEAPTDLRTQIESLMTEKGHSNQHVHLIKDLHEPNELDGQFKLNPSEPRHWQWLKDRLQEKTPGLPDGIVWITGSEAKSHCSGIVNLVNVFQQHSFVGLECGLQLVTHDAVTIENRDVDPDQTKYWGLGRVIGSEQPTFRCRVIDVPLSDEKSDDDFNVSLTALVDILLTETHDNQFAIEGGKIHVPRLTRIGNERLSKHNSFAQSDRCYLVTGGLGALGRQAAKWLVENGAKQIVLVSRRAPDESTQNFLDQIRETNCQIHVHAADVSKREDVQALFEKFGEAWWPLAGVIHAAGVVHDALMADQTWERFERVLAPKIDAAKWLHEFTSELSLDFFILYSSAASVLGSPGQSNYATANAYLDGLVWHRRANGLPALSINWGPWSEGMADDERIRKRLSLQGIAPLAISEAHDAMERLLAGSVQQATVIDVEWKKMRLATGDAPELLSELIPSNQQRQGGDSEFIAKLRGLDSAARKEQLVTRLQKLLQGILSCSDLPDIDRPLIEMGLDSLMAVEFGTELQQLLGEQLAVGPTMLFEYPTISSIADHILELIETESTDGKVEAAEEIPASNHTGIVRDDVAIIGISCRFPGANNSREFWNNLMNRVDSVGEIPEDRWDIDRFYSEQKEPGKMYSREGGFLENIADFDADFFNISELEACWIDPQHRMLLENSYNALEDAGIATFPIADKNVGVFMGIMGQDYAFLPELNEEVINAFQGAGLSHSAGVGRISYLFGFEGPSIAVDTASSSSLVAVLQAVRSLQDGNCNLALAGGVNAILAPVNSLLMSKAGLLAPDGRCKSFSAKADGFGRGEGCGVVVLKRLADAEQAGDRIMAVIRGGAVVHNGSSGSITSPNGKSQTRAILEALNDAKMVPSDVQYLEAHGTGTEFGDPMELTSAASAYGKGRKPTEPLMVGSVKANISHLEAAGGISGLIKTVLAIHHGVIPPQLHFEEPNPHIPWGRLPIRVVDEPTQWNGQRVAGVTALGLVGTNAHVILSDRSPDQTRTVDHASESDVDSPELFTLSARNASALKELARNHGDFLQDHPETRMRDVSYTLGVGRRHYEFRTAFSACNRAEALAKLQWIVERPHLFEPDRNNSSFPKNIDTDQVQRSNNQPNIAAGRIRSAPKIAWNFTEGCHGIGRVAAALWQSHPLFRETIIELNSHLEGHVPKEFVETFLDSFAHAAETAASPISDVQLFAVHAGLSSLWRSWGIEPEVVLGRGVGQFSAACAAGCMSSSDAILLVFEREKMRHGMAANARSDSLSFAEVDLDNFEQFADAYNYYPPNLPLVCSLSGDIIPVHRSLGGSYWRRICAETELPIERLREQAVGTDFELTIGASIQADSEANGAKLLNSVDPASGGIVHLLDLLGRLYVSGADVNFDAFHQRKGSKLSLPTYPYQKKRYWITEVSNHFQHNQLQAD